MTTEAKPRVYDVLARTFIQEGVSTCFALLGDANMNWGARMAEHGAGRDWSWDSCLPAFKRLETDLDFDNEWHGREGPIPIRRHPPEELVPWQAAFLEACAEVGFPACDDSNDPTKTGAGPHSGDAEAGRNGFNAEVLEHVHAWPGYALFALTVVLLIAGWRARAAAPALLRWTLILLAVELVQIAVGLYQARNGLPELAVGVHMVLAALAAATMTVVVLQLKAPVAVAAERVAHS